MPSRNASCPCGSGKKYKTCCFGKHRSQKHEDRAIHEGVDRADAEKPVYKIWEVIKEARDHRDFRLLFQLMEIGPLTNNINEIGAFVEAAQEGQIELPCDDGLDLRRIVLPDDDVFILLADDKSEGSRVRVESWRCAKRDGQWKLTEMVKHTYERPEFDTLPTPQSLHLS